MSIYEIHPLPQLLRGNRYPGRGIIAGLTPDGRRAVAAYFIMGRSANSRNRVFELWDGDLYTRAFDERLVEDPSLILYRAVAACAGGLIVTNGDQTDTIYDGLQAGKSFAASLAGRCFEPDAPNFTPRISAFLQLRGSFGYEMSILKSLDAAGSACCRYTFAYPGQPGLGHFLHTYACDGNPIPTFQGEPERVAIPDSLDELTEQLWQSLDEENKISLYVRAVDLSTGALEQRLINKNQEGAK